MRFPFRVPAIRTLGTLDLSAPITFFVGDNGSGKSTLLEALAIASEVRALGERELSADDTLSGPRELAGALRLAWSRRTRQGFFLRAEDFFGFQKAQARTEARILRERGVLRLAEDPSLVGALHPDEQLAPAFLQMYDCSSHGEAFVEHLTGRVRRGGLHLLDEPETPLSPTRQIELARFLLGAAREKDAQFVVATHSPILLACPGARIYLFGDGPIRAAAYDELDHVRVTRAFLADPGAYLEG